MERIFSQPVVMPCTKEQYNRDLRDKLLSIGYYEDDMVDAGGSYDKLCTFWNDEQNKLNFSSGNFDEGFFKIDEYNPDLFLALAAMTEGNEFYAGEMCKWKITGQILTLTKKGGDFPNCWATDTNGYDSCHESNLIKLSAQEIQNHFSANKNQSNMNNLNKNEKKIIGYNLIKPEYRKPVLEIINWNFLGREENFKVDVEKKH